MRRDNWYTDFLELDRVSLELESILLKWSEVNLTNYHYDNKIDFIPVPKNDKWEIRSIDVNTSMEKQYTTWGLYINNENEEENEVITRKVSNISIESQVLAMALLMNLAEIVENRQRRIISNSIQANRNKIYSYGNRLDCYWEGEGEENKAYYKTGSKQIYEKYFINYELFIKRPKEICEYYYDGLDLYKKLYIVSIDLKNFYDSIDLSLLYEKIKELIKNDIEHDEQNNFIKSIKNILNWETSDGNKFNALPQGLAASGFFANAYLIDFDEAIGRMINDDGSFNDISIKYKLKENIKVRDYCRYVDDLRFVIEANKGVSKETIEKEIEKLVNKIITEEYKGTNIQINNNKTDVVEYEKLIKYPISEKLTKRRALLSGTPSVEDLLENTDALKNLLMQQSYSENGSNKNDLFNLSNIYRKDFDLKETTIKRFVATDLKKSFKLRDSFNIIDTYNEKNFSPLNNEKDFISRLLVYNWLRNPSLLYLLKCALEIHASAELIDPILNIILFKIENYSKMLNALSEEKEKDILEYEYLTIVYLASQILFYSATKIYSKQEDNYNIRRIKEYKESITCFAEKLIQLYDDKEIGVKIPWYTIQGAIFYLVSENRNVPDVKEDTYKLKNYVYLKISAEYKLPQKIAEDSILILCTSLVNQQMNSNKEKFAAWFKKFINRIEEEHTQLNKETKSIEKIKNTIFLLFNYNKDLFEYIYRNKNLGTKSVDYGIEYEKYFEVPKGKCFELQSNQEISFLKIILSRMNPFKYENALLLLLINLLKEDNYDALAKGISLHDITVKCENWNDIQNPNNYNKKNFFKVNIKSIKKNKSNKKIGTNLLEEFPFWLNNNSSFTDWFEDEILDYLAKYNLEDTHILESKEFAKELNEKWDLKQTYNLDRKVLYSIGKIVRSSLIGDYDFTKTKSLQEKLNNQYVGIVNTIFSRSFGFDISLNALTGGEQPISPWLVEVLFNTLRWPYAYQAPHKDGFFTIKGLNRKVKEIIKLQERNYGDMSRLPIYTYPVENNKLMRKESVRIASVQTMMPLIENFDPKNPLYWSTTYRNKHRKHLINLCNLINKHLKAQNVDNTDDLKVDLIVFPELTIHEDDLDILMHLSKQTNASIFAGLTYVEHPLKKGELINRAVWLLNELNEDGVNIKKIYQGKNNVTRGEVDWGITGYRPYQLVIDFKLKDNISWKVSGAICYDATDLKLAADLKDITDTFIVAAMNKDIQTFDNMATALSYHMYQPVIIVNTGEFGGSTAQAPYSGHAKLIAHLHGSKQLGLSIFDISPSDFKNIKEAKIPKKRKTPPAGYPGRPLYGEN